jgi:hypothetical protein
LVDFFDTLFFKMLVRLTALLAKSVIPSLLRRRSYGRQDRVSSRLVPSGCFGPASGQVAQVELSLRFLSCVPGGKIAIWQPTASHRRSTETRLVCELKKENAGAARRPAGGKSPI